MTQSEQRRTCHQHNFGYTGMNNRHSPDEPDDFMSYGIDWDVPCHYLSSRDLTEVPRIMYSYKIMKIDVLFVIDPLRESESYDMDIYLEDLNLLSVSQ